MKLLLHVCCASCATIAIERLQGDWQLVLLFSNSNIFPKEEYIKRLEDTRKIASIFDLE
ncbi:MAG: epoxyqueuosine reductase QueH, partial [Candidatus Helarchaeota archaeon]